MIIAIKGLNLACVVEYYGENTNTLINGPAQPITQSPSKYLHLNMRLMRTKTLDLEELFNICVPEYAILSYTWST